MEVCVLLHYDRPNIAFCSFSGFVVESGNNDAEWKFFVFINVIFFDEVLSFFVGEARWFGGVLANDESPFFDSR